MTTYSYSQLQALWIQAGGSPALAPYAAATAIVESSGNPNAYNASGATGLWQIEYPGSDVPGYSSAQLDNPLDNAKAAVALSKNTMAGLLSNWTAYEPAGAAAAIVKQNGGVAPAKTVPGAASSKGPDTPPGAGNENSPASGSTAGGFGLLSGLSLDSIVSSVSGLFRDVAVVLDYFFGMFGRGQGWRLAFTVLTVVLGFASYKCLAAAGTVPDIHVPAVAHA